MPAEFVVRQISNTVAGQIAGSPGVAVSTVAAGTLITAQESLNLYNKIQDGTATSSDVIATTAAAETILLGVGIAIAAPGIAVAGVVIGIAGAYVFYERNGQAAKDAVNDFWRDINSGKSPLDTISTAIKNFSKNSYKRDLSIPGIENENWKQSQNPSPPRPSGN